MSTINDWNRFCKYYYFDNNLGFSLDISKINFADNFFDSLESKTKAALVLMNDIESGQITNPDENRMVGHYWLRTPDLAPNEDIKTAIISSVKEVKSFTEKIHTGTIRGEKGRKFQNAVIIGIGGSALGPQLVADALGSIEDDITLYFCDNTDPDGIRRIHLQLEDALDETLCLIVSKSGGTVETKNGMIEFESFYKNSGLSFAKHAVAITCKDSKLDNYAREQNWLCQMYMWDWVGGRTSIFSQVGLFPAALQGIDIEYFLEGGKEMDLLTRNQNVVKNPAMLIAAMWYFETEGKAKKDMVVLPYKDRLMLCSKYLQQLVMESLGKEKDLDGKIVHQGIAVYGNKGSTDQHAYVQQLREGVPNFFVTFIEVLNDYVGYYSGNITEVESKNITSGDYLSGFYLGTRSALHENGRGSITITINELNAKTLGALIALFDRAVGFYASFINVNAYHQPGVEAGKKAATKVIEIQKKISEYLEKNPNKEFSAEEISNNLRLSEETETIFKILNHLSANTWKKVLLIKGDSPRSDMFKHVG